MIEIIVCDWSGNISDDTLPVYEANMRLLDDYRRPRISFKEWKRRTGLTPCGFLRNMGILADEQKTFDKYRLYFNEIVASGVRPHIYPHVTSTLEKLSGLRLAVISSHPEEKLREEMQRYGVTEYFSFVLGSVVEKAKELACLCERFHANPSQVLYVGDTIYDVREAKVAHVLSSANCNGYHSRERLEREDPDFVLGEFSWLAWIV
jgi:HAD superfamily hydrolase (TIGR01549 family)